LKILVVDDEPELRSVLKDAFEFEGHEASAAEGGHRALELLKGQRFDLIISDIRMPEGDGLELLRDLRALGNQTPVLLMTGFTHVNEAEAIAMGAVRMILKPFDLDDVIQTISDLEKSAG
jgi:DNA-binding NtrC family response regulator